LVAWLSLLLIVFKEQSLVLEPKKCVFLDYKDEVKGFTLFYINQKNIFVTCNVIFYENHFPFYKHNIYTNLDTHDVFKHLLPSICDNDIVVPISVSDISSVSETVLPSVLLILLNHFI